jgi:hypothetical protein
VHRVEDVAREESVAADPTDLAQPVERQHGVDQVEAEPIGEEARIEDREVAGREAHQEAVDQHQPGARRSGMSNHPRVGGAVGRVGEPSCAPGLVGVGLVAALEAKMLEAPGARLPRHERGRLEGGHVPMVGRGLLEPALCLEQVARLDHLAPDAPPLASRGHRERGQLGGQQDLVRGDLCREAERRLG